MQRIEHRQYKRGTVLEIEVRPSRCRAQVSEGIFRSWSGRRWVDGIEYTGNVYYLGGNIIARRGSLHIDHRVG